MCVRGIYVYSDGITNTKTIGGTFKTLKEAVDNSEWSIGTINGETHSNVFEFAVYDEVGTAAASWCNDINALVEIRELKIAKLDLKPAKLKSQAVHESKSLYDKLFPGVEVTVTISDSIRDSLAGIILKVAFVIEQGYIIKTFDYEVIDI